MSEWKTYKLKDFLLFNPKVPLRKGEFYSFVEMKDLKAERKYVYPKTKRELKGGSRFINMDTLFARISPCTQNGKICQVKELENNIGFGSTEFFVFRGRESISDTDFIHYLVKSDFVKNSAIQMMSGTSGRQRVDRTALENLEIQAPDLPTQQKIAQILTSLDDKIELNLQMNQNLEAIAQTIFKEWFVDFNFPGFDGELVDGLPKGWKVDTLSSICEIKYGKDHKHLKEGKIPVYGSGGIMRYVDTALYQEHSVLIPRKGTLSNLFYVSKPFWSVDTMFYTKIKSDFIRKYIYYFLKAKNLAAMNVGSAVPSLTTKILNKIEVIIPDDTILVRFEELITSFFLRMNENRKQNKSLTQTRDTLLPKLMRGEVNVEAV